MSKGKKTKKGKMVQPSSSHREELYEEYYKKLIEILGSLDEESKKIFINDDNLKLSKELKEKIEKNDLQYVNGLLTIPILNGIRDFCCLKPLIFHDLLKETVVYLSKINNTELTPIEKFIDTICKDYPMAMGLLLVEYGLSITEKLVASPSIPPQGISLDFMKKNNGISNSSAIMAYVGKTKNDIQEESAGRIQSLGREPVIDPEITSYLADLNMDKSRKDRKDVILEKLRITLSGLSQEKMLILLENLLTYIKKGPEKVCDSQFEQLIINTINSLKKDKSRYSDTERDIIVRLSNIEKEAPQQ